MARESGDVAISWQTVVSTALLAVTLLGAGWTLFQAQFGYHERDKDLIRSEITRRENELKETVRSINANLEARRKEFVNQDEHEQFERRIDGRLLSIDDQIKYLNQTRPTTGELAGVAQATRERISDIESKLKMRPSREEVAVMMKAHETLQAEIVTALRREIDALHQEIARINGRALKTQP